MVMAWPTVAWNNVSNLPDLLRRQKELFKHFLELEREIADLDRQIIAAGTPALAPPKTPRRVSRPSAANHGISDVVRETLRVLQLAGEPLAPRELAARMGVDPQIVSRYLAKALKLKLVERGDHARYRVISAVPTLEVRNARTA